MLLSFNWEREASRFLFLPQGAAQFRERDVLQLTDTLTRDAQFPADFFQALSISAVEPETLGNNPLLAGGEHVEQTAYFVVQVFVAQ